MLRLLLLCTLAVMVGLASALLQPPEWAFDAGIFGAFCATLAIIASLAVNSAAVQLRGTRDGGFFGPGLFTTARTFWATMTINLGVGCLLLLLDGSQPRTDSHAMGAEALLALVMGVVAALVGLAFALIRWWPVRLLLAAASGCTAAFACMAITWWR